MCARLCWCALAVGVVLGSLHDNEPMQADEPPIVRGDAPRGLFTPRWEEVQQTYGIERPRGSRSEIFIHRVPQAYGILHRPPWDSGQMNLSMTSLAGLTTSGAGGQMRSGGSKGFMKRRRLPG